MYLNRIDDPRDSLQKARRLELVKFARANGLTHITEAMPANLIRRELRGRGLTRINIPPRPLGQQGGAPPPSAGGENVQEVDADADLMRQFQQEQQAPKPARPPRFKRLVERPKSKINLLRDECKRLGIPMGRRDRTEDLERKIAEHGKDAAQQH